MQGIAVVVLVTDQVIGRRHDIKRQHGGFGIVRISGCQQEGARTAISVAEGVETGVPAASGNADTFCYGLRFAPSAVREP